MMTTMIFKDKLIKICPKCGSTNILSGYNAINHSIKDYCGDCNFNSIEYVIQFFPEIREDEVKKFQEELKNSEEN